MFLSAISEIYLSNGFYCCYKSGQINRKSEQLLFLQIGATIFTNSGQVLQIGTNLFQVRATITNHGNYY